MSHELAKLRRNLAAGCRLALFLPVRRLAFRIDLAQLLLLFAVSALLDVGVDWIRYGPDAQFSWSGAGGEFVSMGLLLLCAAALALAFRQHALALAIPVLVLSAYPIIQIAHVLPLAAPYVESVPDWVGDAVDVVLLGWTFALFFRVIAVALVPAGPHRWRRVAAGGLVVAASIAIAPALMPEQPWWHAASALADGRYPNPASEPVLAAQATLLDDALSNLEDERGGETDLYVVTFAGDAHEAPWRDDVLAAQRVMDERWDTRDRSIALVNSLATVLETPMATVTHLRETLKEIAAAIDTDEDVVMLYLAGPGDRSGTLGVAMPPLELAPVTPAVLRALLDEAGIRWRIVVVAACHAGSFADALANDTTLVLTATGDGATYGCRRTADATNLGAALFGDALLHGDSLRAAFEAAHARLVAGERGDTASRGKGAQLVVGPAMADKLKQLDRARAARGSGRTV